MDLLKATERQENLTQIRTLVQELSNQAMDETVMAINTTTNILLKEMFDDDIEIQLRLHRELKSTNKTKHQVNLQVLYHSNVYDSPGRLSGGEQDRISMAITLALTKISGAPILLLDECMASLDNEIREKCIYALRNHVDNKTIVHICHEAILGLHDSSVTVHQE